MKENELNIICKIRVGSYLYGTNTETSDEDFKGVFLPSVEDLILGNYLGNLPKSIHFDTNNSNKKNSKDDIDCEYYSLQYFLSLIEKGQTIAMEMVFANEKNTISSSEVWQFIVDNRQKCISKNMKSFIGYARSQAIKYSNKGRRMNVIQTVLKDLFQYPSVLLNEIYDKLYTGEYVRKYTEPYNNSKMYEVCGRKFEGNTHIDYVIEQLELIYNNYGRRAEEAKINNVDWKAVSHAIRIAMELDELLTDQKITFPLKQATWLTEVKQGKYTIEYIQNFLESYLSLVESSIKDSILKSSVDMSFFKKWLVNTVYNKDTY